MVAKLLFRHELSFAKTELSPEYRWVFCRNPVVCMRLGEKTFETSGTYSGWLLCRKVWGDETIFMLPSDVFAIHPDLTLNTSFSWRFQGITKDIQFAYAADTRPVVRYCATVYCAKAECRISAVADTPFGALFSVVLIGINYNKNTDASDYP